MSDPTINFFDVGARGKPASLARRLAQWSSMFAFEPDPIEAGEIQANWQGTFRDLEVLTYALSDVLGESNFYECAQPGWSSILRPSRLLEKFTVSKKANVQSVRELEVTTLQTLIDEGVIPNPDFIKLDTQGSEYLILAGLGDSALRGLKGVAVELEFDQLYQGQELFSDVDQLLRGHGLSFYSAQTSSLLRRSPAYSSSRYRTLYCHALYLRVPDLDSETEWDPEAIEKSLLICIGAKFLNDAYDIALELDSRSGHSQWIPFVEEITTSIWKVHPDFPRDLVARIQADSSMPQPKSASIRAKLAGR